jgi:hypothetical protein
MDGSGSEQGRANTVINLRFPQNAGSFFRRWENLGFFMTALLVVTSYITGLSVTLSVGRRMGVSEKQTGKAQKETSVA